MLAYFMPKWCFKSRLFLLIPTNYAHEVCIPQEQREFFRTNGWISFADLLDPKELAILNTIKLLNRKKEPL